MANLYGRLRAWGKDGQPMSGEATRIAHGGIASSLETWDGSIRTELEPDGSFVVFLAPKTGFGTPIIEGNVNDDGRWWIAMGGKQKKRVK